ncbi:MAG: DUF2125 domain-containing protein [Pacificibacter sp.]
MRKLIFLCLGLVVLYSGYWLITARASERGIETWLNSRAAQGWQTEVASVKTRGYPLTFETDLTDLAIADPNTGLAAQTQRFSIKSKSYAPTKLHAQLDQNARISTPFQTIDITNENIGGTLFVEAGPALTMHRAAFDFINVTAKSNLDWGFTVDKASATAVRSEDNRLAHDITMNIENLAPVAAMMSRLNPDGILSDSFDSMKVDATVTFDKDWDITALEGPRPQPTHVVLRNVAATWGALDLRLAGDFKVDANGYPNGKIAVKATNWREMISLATTAGIIPQDLAPLAMSAGEMLAKLKGNSTTIDAELTLARGTISMGFLPLGPAPRITIR